MQKIPETLQETTNEYFRYADYYTDMYAKDHKHFTEEEIKRAINTFREGSGPGKDIASNIIFAHTIRLVVKLASSGPCKTFYYQYGKEMIQEGIRGVYESIKTYDTEHESKSKFSTWTVKFAFHNMSRCISNYAKNTTPYFVKNMSKVNAFVVDKQQRDKDFTMADAIIESEIPYKTINSSMAIINRNNNQFSIDETDENGETYSNNYIPYNETPENHYIEKESAKDMEELLNKVLTETERIVIKSLINTNTDKFTTDSQISADTGIPEKLVRKTKNIALEKLRSAITYSNEVREKEISKTIKLYTALNKKPFAEMAEYFENKMQEEDILNIVI